MIRQEAASTGLMLTPNYTNTRGFHITLNTNGNNNLVDALPTHLIKVVRTKSVISCTTEDLVIIYIYIYIFMNVFVWIFLVSDYQHKNPG